MGCVRVAGAALAALAVGAVGGWLMAWYLTETGWWDTGGSAPTPAGVASPAPAETVPPVVAASPVLAASPPPASPTAPPAPTATARATATARPTATAAPTATTAPTATPSPSPSPAPTAGAAGVPAGAERALVLGEIDGGTVEVQLGRSRYEVELLGVEAPAADACHGPESADFLRRLLVGREVWLERDPAAEDARGDPLRRHVWVTPREGGDAYLASERLARGGYAVAGGPEGARHADRIAAAERAAARAGRGLWAECRDAATATPAR
jgi:endonuclease YncB( thermonuclease family)